MPPSQAQRALELAPEAPTPVIEMGGRNRERAIIDRLEDALAVGAAVTGLRDVLREFELGSVDLLIVPEQSQLNPFAIDRVIDAAAHRGVRVFIVRAETSRLAEHGEVAVVLKRV